MTAAQIAIEIHLAIMVPAALFALRSILSDLTRPVDAPHSRNDFTFPAAVTGTAGSAGGVSLVAPSAHN